MKRGNDGEIDGFTQMVWDETTQMGCAKARYDDPDGSDSDVEYAVCRYVTPSNIDGEYADHVQYPYDCDSDTSSGCDSSFDGDSS